MIQAGTEPESAEAADTDALFERGYAALAKRHPDLASALATLGPPKSRIIGSREGHDLNLDLGHTTLYDGDAERYAEIQIEAFKQRPNRFYMDPPARRDPPDQPHFHLAEALYAHAAELHGQGIEIAATPADRAEGEGGFAIIYGIGLGLHLPALFETARARHFVVVEEHAEFLLHALRLTDWAAIFEGLEARGQNLHFVFGGDMEVVAARVHWYLRGRGFGLIDGSYLFRHYSSTLLDHAYADFVERLPLLPVSIGYFEDELVMIDHSTVNLTRYDFRHLDLRPRLEKELPAIVIGSGPSLDRTMADLKRLAPHAILFSGGTALLSLLRNGIRPDFHCELENTRSSLDHLLKVTAEFSLEGITLLASTTVHPDLPAMFDERVLYFRDSVSSTPLWCPDRTGIHGTAPTCTNLALRAAMAMAFRDIYLFGIDLGTRHPDTHHSKDSIYPTDPTWKVHETEPEKAMTIRLPGNFGGTAWTNQVLHWARMMMAQGIDAFSDATIYNCSDGVSIPGTIPKLSHTIKAVGLEANRMVVLGRLKREMTRIEPREMAPVQTIHDLRAALSRYYQALRQEVHEGLEQSIDFLGFYDRMLSYLPYSGEEPLQGVLRAANVGTLMMCFQVAYFFWRRVPPEAQSGVMRVFLTCLDHRLVYMARKSEDLMTYLLGFEEPGVVHAWTLQQNGLLNVHSNLTVTDLCKPAERLEEQEGR